MKVELNFDTWDEKSVTIELDEKDSQKIKKYLDQRLECEVFFPDYEG